MCYLYQIFYCFDKEKGNSQEGSVVIQYNSIRPLDENSACPEAKTSYWLIAARTISILTNTWMFSFVQSKSKYMEFKYYCIILYIVTLIYVKTISNIWFKGWIWVIKVVRCCYIVWPPSLPGCYLLLYQSNKIFSVVVVVTTSMLKLRKEY